MPSGWPRPSGGCHDDPNRRANACPNGKLAQLRNGWATQRGIYLGVFDALLARDKSKGKREGLAAGLTQVNSRVTGIRRRRQ